MVIIHVIPALGRPTKEDCHFKVTCNKASPCLNSHPPQKKRKRKKGEQSVCVCDNSAAPWPPSPPPPRPCSRLLLWGQWDPDRQTPECHRVCWCQVCWGALAQSRQVGGTRSGSKSSHVTKTPTLPAVLLEGSLRGLALGTQNLQRMETTWSRPPDSQMEFRAQLPSWLHITLFKCSSFSLKIFINCAKGLTVVLTDFVNLCTYNGLWTNSSAILS
jgi:hypothetical protein